MSGLDQWSVLAGNNNAKSAQACLGIQLSYFVSEFGVSLRICAIVWNALNETPGFVSCAQKNYLLRAMRLLRENFTEAHGYAMLGTGEKKISDGSIIL